MNEDEGVLETLEIDLDVAECIEILEAHGADWTPDLVEALWAWKESGREPHEAAS